MFKLPFVKRKDHEELQRRVAELEKWVKAAHEQMLREGRPVPQIVIVPGGGGGGGPRDP